VSLPQESAERFGRFAFVLTILLVGPMLVQELLFRGFLLPQIAGRLRGSDRMRLAGGVAFSSILFATAHLPKAIAGYSASGAELGHALLWWTLAGVVYAILYIRTRNLFYVIGIHSLANLLGGSTYGGLIVFGLASVMAAAWPLLRRLPPRHAASAPARPASIHSQGCSHA
jgi:membrane protease YdiL (CAAX protease family)